MKNPESSDAPKGEIRQPLREDLQKEIAHRVLVNGEQQRAVQADFAIRGIAVSAATISRICQRVKTRAAAAPPTIHTDPVTGIEVEYSDDGMLQALGRDLWREYRKAELRDKIQIAKVLPAVAVARQRIREPVQSKPQDPGQPQPPEPAQPTECVRFN